MQTPLTFLAAFVVVLALIALAAWLVRRFAGNNLSNSANRGRAPRLAVIDAAAVDGRRRLVLVRRDNVEHLLMIGGPTDVVVELNIVRAMPARDAAPQRPAGELPSRGVIPDAPVWADGDGRPDDLDSPDQPMPEPAPTRPARPAFVDELRRTQSAERRAPEPSPPAFTPEPPPRAEPPARQEPRLESSVPPRQPRPDAPPRPSRLSETIGRIPRPPERVSPPAMPAAPTASQAGAEQELSNMTHRLEAALRRPAEAAPAEPPAMSEPDPAPPPRPPRVTPPPPIVEVTTPTPLPAPPTPTQTRGFDNLEDEMASLLGRPKSSSS